MKTRILSMVLVLTLLLGAVAALASCGACTHEGTWSAWSRADADNHQRVCSKCQAVETVKHSFVTDEDADEMAAELPQTCAACGAKRSIENTADRFAMEFESKTYPWDSADIVMSVNDNSNGKELEAGGMAYVSGEWSKDNKTNETVASVDDSILQDIRQRNNAATNATGVNVTYRYMKDYGWGLVLGQITTETSADGTPDVYYNFIYDMVGASINGMFSNILGNKNLGTFYDTYDPEKNTQGFNWEYMNDLTFSTKAMYLIASDYSFDIARAYFVMPVNTALLEAVTTVTGDVDGDGDVGTVDDFFKMIDNGDWTWTKIAAYADAVKKPDSEKGGYALQESNSIIGFAMSTSSGLSSTPFIFGSDISLVNRDVDPSTGEYVYSYPSPAPDSFVEIFSVAQTIIGLPGQGTSLNDASAGTAGVVLYEGSTSLAADTFAAGRVLVDSSCLLGAIERDIYQNMWNEDNGGKGFLVAPVAKVTADQEDYRTLIHNIGKVFAISTKSEYVDEALAFITYQTVKSTPILEDYYTWSIGYARAVTDANVAILLEMGEKLRYGVDKVVEDAIGLIYADETIIDPLGDGKDTIQGRALRWHTYLLKHYEIGAGITGLYEGCYEWKEAKVVSIQESFLKNLNKDAE